MIDFGISRAVGGVVRALCRAVAALVLFATPVTAAAQDVAQRARDIIEAMQGEAIYTDVFDERFTARVSQEQFSAIFAQAERQYGPLVGLDSVEPTSPTAANITSGSSAGSIGACSILPASRPIASRAFS